MIRSRTLCLAIALAITACSTENSAQNSKGKTRSASSTPAASVASAADPTSEDISNYPLDMDKLRKLQRTMKYFAEAGQGDPTLGDALSMNGNATTAQTIAQLEGNATARAVLRKAGWSAKDYVWTTAAVLQAGMLESTLSSRSDAKLPPGHNPRNVEFVRAHKKEIEQMSAENGSN
jgi:hypothetical protein